MLIIKIVDGKNRDQWTAEVTTPHGTWESPHPMSRRELRSKLLSMGLDMDEIWKAENKAYIEHAESEYRRLGEEFLPLLQAALAGEREVPEQRPRTEAWLAYALPTSDMMISLIQVIDNANFILDCYPTADEISWAFLRLKRRGWLVVEGDMYGLTPEGKRAIKEIENDNSRWPSKLVERMLDHPLPGDDKALIWRAETKVGAKNAESEYRRLEKIYLPFLQAALAGERKVPPPKRPRIEVWFAYALYRHDGMRSLWEVIGSADEVFHEIPHYDDISWAFLRLRKLGWLMIDGEWFGLTPEGRHVVQDIWSEYNGPYWYEKLDHIPPKNRHVIQGWLNKDDDLYWYAKIDKWLLKHPMPGDE